MLFDSWRVYPVGSDPRSACFADFNNDEHVDIAVACHDVDEIYVLINAGDGSLYPAIAYWVGEDSWSIDGADLDHDGDIDLVVGITHDISSIAVLLNHGDGTFSLPSYYGPPGRCHSVRIADFNNDGHLDIAGAASRSQCAVILFNYGDGTFTYPLSTPRGWEPRCVIPMDNDGDNDMDLIVVDRVYDDVFLFQNNGEGKFLLADTYQLELDPSFAAAADLNHDGYEDLIVNMERSDSLAILYAVGDGTFSSPERYYVGQYCLFMHPADYNGDTYVDILACIDYRDFAVLYGNDSGTFSEPHGQGLRFRFAYMTDIDENGAKELIGIGGAAALVSVFPVIDGDLPALQRYCENQRVYDIAAGDFDGDGDCDLVAGTDSSGSDLLLLKNYGDGSFREIQTISLDARPHSFIEGDLDNNGTIDLLIGKFSEESFLIMLNNGTGLFEAHAEIIIPDYREIYISDIDGDHDLDLLYSVYHYDSNIDSIYTFQNLGSAVFEPWTAQSAEIPFVNYSIGDFDGNGVIDIAAASIAENGIAVLLDAGPGLFDPPATYNILARPYILESADIDSDNDIDIVALSYLDGELALLRNNGDGSFFPHVVGTVPGRQTELISADLDVDGHSDLFSVLFNWQQPAVGATSTDSDGSFLPTEFYGGGGNPIALADFDGDGDPDVAGATQNGITLLFNRAKIVTDVDSPDEAGMNGYGWQLSQNFPNPFNPITLIEYRISSRNHVTLDVYNVLGQKIKTLVDDVQMPGDYSVSWNGKDKFGRSASSGVYFYRLSVGDLSETRKMILLK